MNSKRRLSIMSAHEDPGFEQEVERLLADAAHADHPLHEALAELYCRYQEQFHQLERITRISDHFQEVTRNQQLSLSERYKKELRKIERLARISDRYQELTRELNEALKEASLRDPLTGLGNRRMVLERMEDEVRRSKRLGRPFALILADVDHFKQINDSLGHATGDKVLVRVADALRAELRDYDSCARWGGEEFLALLPESDVGQALAVAERMRLALNSVVPAESMPGLTASFGVSQFVCTEAVSQTLGRADAALYRAKSKGRNRCEIELDAAGAPH